MSTPFYSLIWNLRGFGAPGRQRQLKEYMRQENVDIVGLQETIKESFLLHELEGLSRHKFAWHWVPAVGHSGGILLGVKEDTFEVDDMDHGEFFVSMALTHRCSNLIWEVIMVYGPADHRRSPAFLAELTSKVVRCMTPVMIAGDFNLIRSPEDKSSAHVDLPRMRMFNDCIADLALREITRAGARYT
jgi:exonuclease III